MVGLQEEIASPCGAKVNRKPPGSGLKKGYYSITIAGLNGSAPEAFG